MHTLVVRTIGIDSRRVILLSVFLSTSVRRDGIQAIPPHCFVKKKHEATSCLLTMTYRT